MNEKLKPCPFCGREAELVMKDITPDCARVEEVAWYIGCKKEECFAATDWDSFYKDKKLAIDAWNKRSRRYGMTGDKMLTEEEMWYIRGIVIGSRSGIASTAEVYGIPRWVVFMRKHSLLPFWVLGMMNCLEKLELNINLLHESLEV